MIIDQKKYQAKNEPSSWTDALKIILYKILFFIFCIGGILYYIYLYTQNTEQREKSAQEKMEEELLMEELSKYKNLDDVI